VPTPGIDSKGSPRTDATPTIPIDRMPAVLKKT
jgi:hypothetical protein